MLRYSLWVVCFWQERLIGLTGHDMWIYCLENKHRLCGIWVRDKLVWPPHRLTSGYCFFSRKISCRVTWLIPTLRWTRLSLRTFTSTVTFRKPQEGPGKDGDSPVLSCLEASWQPSSLHFGFFNFIVLLQILSLHWIEGVAFSKPSTSGLVGTWRNGLWSHLPSRVICDTSSRVTRENDHVHQRLGGSENGPAR